MELTEHWATGMIAMTKPLGAGVILWQIYSIKDIDIHYTNTV